MLQDKSVGNRISRLLCLCAGVSALALAIGTSASAQIANYVTDADGLATSGEGVGKVLQPPVTSSVDEHGVDLVSGRLLITENSLGIGGGGSGIVRNGAGFNVPYTDNFSGAINESNFGATLTVTFGQGAETFNASGGGWVSSNGSGNQLTCNSTNCTYKLIDGTVAVFNRDELFADSNTQRGQVANHGLLKTITKPDGEVITLTYRGYQDPSTGYIVRSLKTVSSSMGWAVKYTVQGNNPANFKPVEVAVYNSSIDYCDVNAELSTCTLTTARRLTISGTTNITVTDSSGVNTTYKTVPRVTSIEMPSGAIKSVSYDSNGWVSSVSIAGSTWTYSYSVSGGILTATRSDPTNKTRVIEYDYADAFIASSQDELGRKTQYRKDAKGRVEYVINPDATFSGSTPTGGYTQYVYSNSSNYGDRDLVTDVKVYPKGGGTPLVTSATYAGASSCSSTVACNKPLTVTDAAGVTTTYTYYASHGGIDTVTLPAVGGVSPQTRYTYTQFTPYVKNSSGGHTAQPPVWRLTGVSSCMTKSSCSSSDPDERKTTIAYGGNNVFSTSVTVSLGNNSLSQTNTFAYDGFGNVTSVDGPKSGSADTTYFFYDNMGRRKGAISPDPDGGAARPRFAQRTYYDNDGRAWKSESGTTTGTSWSDVTGMAVASQQTVEFGYLSGLPWVYKNYHGGNLTGQAELYYNSRLQVECAVRRTNPSNLGSEGTACTAGFLHSSAQDSVSKYLYDDTGAILSIQSGHGTDLVQNEQVRTYDAANGLLTTIADGKGNKTTFHYDNFYRPISTCYPIASSGTISSTTDCDQTGYNSSFYNGARVYSVTRRDASTIYFGYDALGRVTSQSGAQTANFAYDNFSQLTSHTANGQTSTYVYNALGWMLEDNQPLGKVTYEYDAYGKRSRMWWPGNTFSVTYEYTDGDDLARIWENGSYEILGYGLTSLGQPHLDYRPNGQYTWFNYDTQQRVSSLTMPSNTQTLNYNAANQLISKGNSNTAYDVSVGTSSTGYSINGLNQITSVGGTSLSYDARGNLTGDGSSSFSYNTLNLLTSATQSGVTTSLAYDAENRLLSISKPGIGTTQFLYDGSDIIAEFDGFGTLLRRYVHGPGMDEARVWYEGAGTSDKRYLYADYLGSIVATADSSGTVLNTSTYDEYGLRTDSNAAYASRFSYTGQAWLAEIGMYYYKNRLYNPVLGRFMQPDPMGYGDGVNMYAYVGNDPLNNTDPWGLEEKKKKPDDGEITTVTVTGIRGGGVGGLVGIAGGGGRPSPAAQPNDDITEVIVVGKRPRKDYILGPFLKRILSGTDDGKCGYFSDVVGQRTDKLDGYYYFNANIGAFSGGGMMVEFVSGYQVKNGVITKAFEGTNLKPGIGVYLGAGIGYNYSDSNPINSRSNSTFSLNLAAGPISGSFGSSGSSYRDQKYSGFSFGGGPGEGLQFGGFISADKATRSSCGS